MFQSLTEPCIIVLVNINSRGRRGSRGGNWFWRGGGGGLRFWPARRPCVFGTLPGANFSDWVPAVVPACVSILQHTPAQHTSACVSIRQHTAAYISTPTYLEVSLSHHACQGQWQGKPSTQKHPGRQLQGITGGGGAGGSAASVSSLTPSLSSSAYRPRQHR